MSETKSTNGRIPKAKKATSSPTASQLEKMAERYKDAGDAYQAVEFENAARDLASDPDDNQKILRASNEDAKPRPR